jgi:hypothetical protein
MPTEAAVFAVGVVSLQGSKGSPDDPKGILYLTDQRLIFEQKQEIATKKFLFITTEKQKVQKLVFEVPALTYLAPRPDACRSSSPGSGTTI